MRRRILFLVRHDFCIWFSYPIITPFLLPSFTAMEDCSMLAADCVVISCCCQCLILQIIFILLKLPCKLIRKAKEYAKKKLGTLYRKQAERRTESVKGRFQDDSVEFHEGSIKIQIEELHGSHGLGSCVEEVERVIGDFSQKGEFAFGSFWGRGKGKD